MAKSQAGQGTGMGEVRHDGAGAKSTGPDSSLWSHDPWGGTWAPAPCTQGERRHCQRIKTSTKEKENKLPTSNLHPIPASFMAHGYPPARGENHRPTPPICCLAWAQQKGVGAGGPTTSHTPSPLQPPSLPKGARIPSPLSGIPSCPVLMSLDSHPQRTRQELTEP